MDPCPERCGQLVAVQRRRFGIDTVLPVYSHRLLPPLQRVNCSRQISVNVFKSGTLTPQHASPAVETGSYWPSNTSVPHSGFIDINEEYFHILKKKKNDPVECMHTSSFR